MSGATMSQPKVGKDFSVIQTENSGCCVILVVDDDPDMRSLLADELGEEGCRIFQAKNGVDALSQINECPPNLIITDLNMKFGGFEFLRSLKRALPGCPAIVITAFGDSRTRAKVMESGMAGYFDKPVRMGDLKSLVKKVCLVQDCVFDRSSDLMQP